MKKEKTRYGWSVIFTYLVLFIGTGDSGMYTIVRKDCLCLAAGFLQIYVDVYVRSLLYLT